MAYRHIGGSTFNIQFPDGYATIKVPSQLYLNAKMEFKAVLKSGLDIIPSLFYRTTQTSKWINGILSVQSSFVFKKWFDASPTMDIVGGKISNSGLIIGLYPLNWFMKNNPNINLRFGVSRCSSRFIFNREHVNEFTLHFTRKIFEY